jgi:pyruvate,water dikinase
VEALYWLDRPNFTHRSQSGEKAYALSQLKRQGYPVRSGFVISAELCREFLKKIDNRSFRTLNVSDRQSLQQFSQQHQQEILRQTLPEECFSAIFLAAQQLESSTLILRVSLSLPPTVKHQLSGLLSAQICQCEPGTLEKTIALIWSELFSAKSLFYWLRQKIDLEQIHCAILVQPISDAIASGTLEFRGDRLEIESTWGLGYSLFKGEVLPDRYTIHLPTEKIVTQHLGNKTLAYRLKSTPVEGEECLETYLLGDREQESYSLDEIHLKQAIELARRINAQYSNIRSLEWTIAQSSQFYITQIHFQPAATIPKIKVSGKMPANSSHHLLSGIAASPGQVIALARAIANGENVAEIPSGRIWVVEKISPEWLPQLKQAAGIIAERGGVTSHAAILARELEIPCIVNVSDARQHIQTGEYLLLDGNRGTIYPLEKSPGKLVSSSKRKRHVVAPTFHYPLGTGLMVNLSQPNAIAASAALPVDGVGLLRSEWMMGEMLAEKSLERWLNSFDSLFVNRLGDAIAKFTQGFAPRPVFYRSADWQVLESAKELQTHSSKPRGTYGYQLDPTLFDLELQALKQVADAGETNLKLILPFVRSLEEFKFCRDRVERAGLFQQSQFQLWMMAEVPAVIFLIPEFVKAGASGISIGSNDLTQLVLGVDREEALSFGLNACHPAIIKAIEHLIQQAKAAGIPCSICGQAPVQYPELIDRLVKWGISSISVEPEAVETTYRAIARAEQRLLLEAARHR